MMKRLVRTISTLAFAAALALSFAATSSAASAATFADTHGATIDRAPASQPASSGTPIKTAGISWE